jgi:thiamine-monophosphate kinase
VGGDTTSGKTLVVTVQIVGDVASGMAIKRSGAQPGDNIYVTGTVGDAAAGLELLTAGNPQPYLSARFFRPDARIEFGQALVGAASAAIDVSDGLFADLGKLLAASGVGGALDLEALPLSDELREQFDVEAQRRMALSGGDDYELCFTAPADTEFPDCKTRVTKIGSVLAGNGLQCQLAGALVPYADSGYRHFK